MVKIRKDILEYLQIEHLFITGMKNSFCNLIEIEKNEWIVTMDSDINDEKAILNVKTNGVYIEVPVLINKKGSTVYSLQIQKNKCRKKLFLELQERIIQLENNHAQWEKRKEDRYVIADKNVDKFNLEQATQNIVQNKIQIPCVINNVSFCGANITTIMTDKVEFKANSEIVLILRFVKPIEQIILKAYIQSVGVKTANNSDRYKFAILALKLIEPPLSYKTRLNNYIDAISQEK